MRLHNGASLRLALMLCLASLVMALARDLSALDLPVMHDRFRQIALGLFLVLVGWTLVVCVSCSTAVWAVVRCRSR